MKITLAIFVIFITGQIAFGQGYGIADEFYPYSIPEGKSYDQKFWKRQVKKLTKKSNKKPNDPELLYSLAIAKSRVLKSNLTDAILVLDEAIKIDSTQAKYFAVRGIVKYDWGAYSPDYDISEGCPDIQKALEMDLEDSLKNIEALSGILSHSSCKEVVLTKSGIIRDSIDLQNFNDVISVYTWGRINEFPNESNNDLKHSYAIVLSDSTFNMEAFDHSHMNITCSSKLTIEKNLMKVEDFDCIGRMITKYIYGFIENGILYLSYEQENFQLNDDLIEIINNRLGWSPYEVIVEEK